MIKFRTLIDTYTLYIVLYYGYAVDWLKRVIPDIIQMYWVLARKHLNNFREDVQEHNKIKRLSKLVAYLGSRRREGLDYFKTVEEIRQQAVDNFSEEKAEAVAKELGEL